VNKFVKESSGIKVYFSGHSDITNSARLFITKHLYYPFYIRNILRFFGDCVHFFLPVNPSSGEFLSKFLGISVLRIKIFPLSLDVNYFQTLRLTERNVQRKKFGINEGDIVFISGGQLYPSKQTHDLIEAFNLFKSANLHLFIFGNFVDSTYELLIKNMIRGNDQIKYLGFLSNDDVNKVMSASDIAIFPCSQTVLWQRSLALSQVLVIGRYVKYLKEYQEQDVDYLIHDNCGFVLNSKGSKVEEIRNIMSQFLSGEMDIEFYQDNALNRAHELIDIYKNINNLIK
jgi:glycosyltransferase involved in cell wall biosynthesis